MRAEIKGSAPPAPGTLAAHGGTRRRWLREHLRRIAANGAFFKPGMTSDDDRGIIADQLPEGSGPRVVIYGHTHAARDIDFGDGRVYINTGTWMDLMKLPDFASDLEDKAAAEAESDAKAKAWIDRLEANEVERVTDRRTWAEVTADGAFLRGLPKA